MRREGKERHVGVRASEPSQTGSRDDGTCFQTEYRRLARIPCKIHRHQGDAGLQQCKHPRCGTECQGAPCVQADRLPRGLRKGRHRGLPYRPRPVQDP